MSQPQKRSNTPWYIAAAVIVAVIILSSAYTYELAQTGGSASPSPTAPSSSSSSPTAGTVTITVYAGELSSSSYGFGNTSGYITSPGPTFTVKVGTTVTVEFTNSGTELHNWALVTQKTSGNTNLAFSKAQIASAGNPVPPGGKASTTFVANKAGTYYYICQVDGHVALGMWGNFVVTS